MWSRHIVSVLLDEYNRRRQMQFQAKVLKCTTAAENYLSPFR
jgi:hypothetical protein